MRLISLLSAVLASFSAVSALATSACDISEAKPVFPPQFTQPNAPLSNIALGVGVRNYTYNATGKTWVNQGGVAQLFDISCFYGAPVFDQLVNITYDLWTSGPGASITSKQLTDMFIHVNYPLPANVLGELYFVIPSPGAPIASKWDFRNHGVTKGNPDAYMVGVKDFSAPVPYGNTTRDVDENQYHAIGGKLATDSYRFNAKGGAAPSTAAADGTKVSIKYTYQIWFYGSSL